MLMGEYHHSVDEKGRIIIPSKFRDELGNSIVITRGIEDCLFVYSEDEWTSIVSKLKTLPFTKQDARNFTRLFLSGATISEFDKQGRIKLTQPLISYATIIKDCVIVGVNDRLEIWSEEKWNEFFNNNKENMTVLADHLFETEL